MVEAIAIGSQGILDQAIAATRNVAQAIRKASAQAGVDFAYMLNKATQESGLDPNAKASTSSATGLYQFVEQTWLRTLKAHGEKYGLGAMADKIAIGNDGAARVADPAAKQAILALRKDPTVAAEMAAELTNENKAALQSNLGGKIGATELYLAHFLGAGGATQFLAAMRNDPNAKAATILPDAASSNQAVFFDKSGAPRSVAQIYKHFAEKFDRAPALQSPRPTQLADASLTTTALNATSLAQDVITPYASPATLSHGGTQAAINSFRNDGNGSSAFATMVLAQLDMGSLSPLATTAYDKTETQKRKTVWSSTGTLA